MPFWHKIMGIWYLPIGRGEDDCVTVLLRYDDFMTLKAIIHKAEEGGFWAEVPALPGCVTQGETMEELRTNLQDAMKLWLEAGELETTENEEHQILELAI
jgi:predicted RNase H-like HicB family nuclease